jgi:hypothetical protein
MKTKSAMIASVGFQTLTYFGCDSLKERTLGRRRALGAVLWEAEQPVDSTPGKTKGGFDELERAAGTAVAAGVVVALRRRRITWAFMYAASGSAFPLESSTPPQGFDVCSKLTIESEARPVQGSHRVKPALPLKRGDKALRLRRPAPGDNFGLGKDRLGGPVFFVWRVAVLAEDSSAAAPIT